MKVYNVNLAERQIASLKKLSKQLQLPVAELIRRAIDEFLKREEVEPQ